MPIEPTVGRVVWYHPAVLDSLDIVRVSGRPLAAHIAFVHSPTLVNLMVIDANGKPHSLTSVYLVQDGTPPPMSGSSYCEWMPYQKGQAAKTEALELAAKARAQGEGSY